MQIKACAIISTLCCLLISGCNSTDSVVVKTETVRERVPAALIRPCPAKQRKPLVTTGDLVNRLVYTEGALDTCAAQVAGIARWDRGE